MALRFETHYSAPEEIYTPEIGGAGCMMKSHTHSIPHTPGPWTAERRNKTTEVGNFIVVDPAEGPCIGYIADSIDARLIAAAPDLLEALKMMMAASDHIPCICTSCQNRALAAIAKAEGRTP